MGHISPAITFGALGVQSTSTTSFVRLQVSTLTRSAFRVTVFATSSIPVCATFMAYAHTKTLVVLLYHTRATIPSLYLRFFVCGCVALASCISSLLYFICYGVCSGVYLRSVRDASRLALARASTSRYANCCLYHAPLGSCIPVPIFRPSSS